MVISMKIIRVVAAIICDDMNAPSEFLRQPEDTENSKASGNFQAVRLRKGKRRKMRFIEKFEKNWIQR